MEKALLIAILILLTLFFIVIMFRINRIENDDAFNIASDLQKNLDLLRETIEKSIKESRQETLQYVQTSFKSLGDILSTSQKQTSDIQDRRLSELNQQLTLRNDTLQKTVGEMLKQINDTTENRLISMQRDNEKKLEQMRETVNEKLQKTLEERIGKSFQVVSERLEQVYKGLGEMQHLAAGVGDLKKVLSNVKTRGILGEIQLGAILEQILSPDQYEENAPMKKGGGERVEYAIKLPGDGEDTVYLPIDAKFPADAYSRLMEAYESGVPAKIETAANNLDKTIKTFAKSIKDKYINPPVTTDFGIMFLPFEGLYAEVVRRGLVETLQRDYKINIAGPTTMAALLNSLQMGFRTLAIQKRSSEVWNVLGAVKTEFGKFEKVLSATQQRINQANAELDKLVGARTRKIQSKLRGITALSESGSRSILEIEEEDIPENPEESEDSV